MTVNLQFIADKANVSKSLVSRVLNNKDVRVSDEKRELIIRLAEEYEYQSNQIAASLRTQKTNMDSVDSSDIYTLIFMDSWPIRLRPLREKEAIMFSSAIPKRILLLSVITSVCIETGLLTESS